MESEILCNLTLSSHALAQELLWLSFKVHFLYVCMYVYVGMCTWEPPETLYSPGAGATSSWNHLTEVLGPKSGPL